MNDISILIGGKAGDGIKQAGNMIARIFNQLDWWSFVYEDYQSLIKGGHNFAVIRSSLAKIDSHKDKIDILIALDQNTLDQHRDSIKKDTLVIFDSDICQFNKGIGVAMSAIAKNNNLPSIVRNVVALGALAKVLNIDFKYVEEIIRGSIKVKVEDNIKVSKLGFEKVTAKIVLEDEPRRSRPTWQAILSGNEAIALGAAKAGLNLYIAYPMTPASSILHFFAENTEKGVKAIQPENEISAALMAEGVAFAGKRVMVGTSGGGFALMTEALSFAGMAELPVMFILSQRYSPSTGAPTYTGQGDLNFALNAGQGEFPKIVVAPGNAEQAYYLSAELLNLTWKFQAPTILISDKHLSESTFTADIDENKIKIDLPKMWDGNGEYLRYKITSDGISPLAFPGNKDAVVKASSYEHNEYGIAMDDAKSIQKMMDKRIAKQKTIIKELRKIETVKVWGNKKSKTAIIGWGSVAGAAAEIAKDLDIKFIQPLFLEPFPDWAIQKELKGVKNLIDVEMNATGQLAKILKAYDIECKHTILKYNGRSFTCDELKARILKIKK